MDKIRKLIDIIPEDMPYLQMLAAKRRQPLKNMIEDLIHQVAISTKNEEFVNRVEEIRERKKS